jgi:hypothetical protein
MTSILKVDTIQTAAGGTPTAADLGLNVTGSVLQVVSSTKTDTAVFSSDSYIDLIDLSVTITPSSTSSKILITGSIKGAGTSTVCRLHGRLVRNGTPIFVGDAAGSRDLCAFEFYKADAEGVDDASLNFLDAPNTTSAVTYKIQAREINAQASSVFVNRNQADPDASKTPRFASTITVMEIAG